MNRVFTKDNYITIQGFAIVQLGLSGNELILFSLIHGFSQDGETEFKGSLSYIVSALNITKANAKHVLDRLVAKNLIEKRDVTENGVKSCRYKVAEGVIKTITGCYQNDNGGGIETIPYNNSYNNKDNNKPILSVEEKRKIFAEKCEPYVAQYGREMINDFIRYWTEANGNKLKCEIARQRSGAFEISRRLATWASKDYNKSSVKPQQEQKPSRPQKPIWEQMGLSYEDYVKYINSQK